MRGVIVYTEGYGSHEPVLDYILKNFNISNVLEFGMGNFSTLVFSKYGKRTVSVESNPEWFEKVKNKIGESELCKLILWPNEDLQDYFKTDDSKYDLVFVDGPTGSRVPCVNLSFNRSNIIVLHDTDADCWPHYHLDRIIMPDSYVRYDFTLLSPWTSIYVSNVPNFVLSDINV